MQYKVFNDFKSKVRTQTNMLKRKPNKDNTHKVIPQPSLAKAPRFITYTLLNTSKSPVLEETFRVELLNAPRKANSPPNTDTTRQCQYHRNFGHNTNECAVLRDKI